MASVRWSRRALRDVRAIREYIEDASSEPIAGRVSSAITQSTRPLANFPQLGRVVPEYHDPSFRELISGSYRVTYLVRDDDSVFVVAVVDGRRDLVGALGMDPRRIV
jgi:toxin ParE1/3/4